MMNNRVPKVAEEHIKKLREEKKQFESLLNAQVGTEVLEYFSKLKTAVINPSNIGVGILDRMVDTDDTVSSAIEFKTLMTLSKIGEYEHKDPKIKEYVNRFLKRMRGPTWQHSLESQLSACVFGFSVSEIIWGVDKDYQQVPMRVPTYHPSTICFEMDREGIAEDGVLQFTSQFNQHANPNNYWPEVKYGWKVKNPYTTPHDRLLPTRVPYINNMGVVRIPRRKVIHHVYRAGRSFGSPYGKTPVRTAHLLWQLKNFFIKQMGVAGKKASTPTLHGQAPRGQNVEVKKPDGSSEQLTPRQALMDMLKDMESNDSIVTGSEKDGWGVSVLQNAVQLGNFTDVINAIDVWMFRCFLLPSLVMTDGSAGSRSLGDKHFEIVDTIAMADARNFTQTIINDMIEPAIVKNFGPQEDYGSFINQTEKIEELEKLANVYSTAGMAGFIDNWVKSDKDFVRAKLGLQPSESVGPPPMENDPYTDDGEDEPTV